MPERPDVEGIRLRTVNLTPYAWLPTDARQLLDYIATLEARLRAATERCHPCGFFLVGEFCGDCQSDLDLLDGTPEPTT